MSTDGKVIVGYGDASGIQDTVAVKWSGAALSPTVLGLGYAQCVNADGSVIAGNDGGDTPVAMLWDSAGAHNLLDLLGATSDLSGWSLRSATGISDDGKFVVGYGTHGTATEGWVAHLP